MMFFAFFSYMMYLAVIAAIFYGVYKIGDGWMNKSLQVRREQNDLLKELVEVMKERK